jgi:hypothetical protein
VDSYFERAQCQAGDDHDCNDGGDLRADERGAHATTRTLRAGSSGSFEIYREIRTTQRDCGHKAGE